MRTSEAVFKKLTLPIAASIRPSYHATPFEWCGKSVHLAEGRKFDPDYSPYIRDPLAVWGLPGRARSTIVAIEQTGKSLSWQLGMTWRYSSRPAPALVVYESDKKAERINRYLFEPILSSVPAIKIQLENSATKTKDCYDFSQSPLFFTGGGSDITSYPLSILVGDEVDNWIRHSESVDNVTNLDKRRRSRDDGKLFLVCSIKGSESESIIWREFLLSSMGYWHLRCLGCGELTMRSCDIGGVEQGGNWIGGLQWELQDGEPVDASIRLLCPKCGRPHCESEKRAMNVNGAYIHERPDRIQEKDPHYGFQWGALAGQAPGLSWMEIARAKMLAGRGNIKAQLAFDNSWRGMPFKPRYLNAPLIEQLYTLRHPAPPENERMGSFIAVDTQGDDAHSGYFYWAYGVLSTMDRLHVLSCGKAKTFDDLDAAIKQAWNLVGYIHDEGGKRELEVRRFIAKHRRGLYFSYKGGYFRSLVHASKEVDSLLLVREKDYKAALIRTLYHQRDGQEGRIGFNPDLPDEFFKQVGSVQRPVKIKTKDDYKEENWESPSGDDHYFDCLKMMLVIKEYQAQRLPKEFWKNGKPTELQAKSVQKIVLKPRANGGWRIK